VNDEQDGARQSATRTASRRHGGRTAAGR
jgi:hypothetical protein